MKPITLTPAQLDAALEGAPPAVCEYCQAPADGDRRNANGRMEPVCADCCGELDRSDEIDRQDAAYEDACDQAIAEWKDEGKVGMPRQVRRR